MDVGGSPDFEVIVENDDLTTEGLEQDLGFEIQIKVEASGDLAKVHAASNLIRNLGQYFRKSPKPLKAGERVDWASSLLVARTAAPGIIALDEMAFDGKTVLQGVSRCLRIWMEQSDTCKRMHSRFLATHYGSLLAASPGALDAVDGVEGIRYDGSGEMSGWWLFGHGYDGSVDNFASMHVVHVFHVIERQPRLASLLGLDTGFCFRIGSANDVSIWYEAAGAETS